MRTQVMNLRRWLQLHRLQAVALLAWGIFAYIVNRRMYENDMTLFGILEVLSQQLLYPVYGMALYVLLYVLRPLTLFPGTPLTMLAGFLYGFWLGLLLALVASLLSTALPYMMGRWFTDEAKLVDEIEQHEEWFWRLLGTMRHNPFQTVLTVRFLYLPYDTVNFIAGQLQIPLVPFFLATLVGNLVNAIAIVGIGAAIEGDFETGDFSINPTIIGFSLLVWFISFLLARWLRKRENFSEMRQQHVEGDIG